MTLGAHGSQLLIQLDDYAAGPLASLGAVVRLQATQFSPCFLDTT